MKTSLLILAGLLLLNGCGNSQSQLAEKELARLEERSKHQWLDQNSKVIEFTPDQSNHLHCIFVDGFRNGGLYCYEKSK